MEALGVSFSRRLGLGMSVVGAFMLRWRDMLNRRVESGGVEPFDVLGGGQHALAR